MIPIKIIKNDYVIRNIKLEELNEALNCINRSEESYKTLGRDNYLTFDDIMQRYLETLTNSLEFFCGVYIEEKLIGIIKGRIENNIQKELWLMSIIVLEKYRMKGFGTSIIKDIEEFFIKNYSVKVFCALVVDDNISGKYFWNKNDYKMVRTIKGMISNDKNMTIYKKQIE
ncbi:Acetyltransferase (GNAT) domain-containing protein [Caloramator quimbayensis]|uniref:Acetyltransferase (GNAT) domain-containing protein n=1 Tax=Caloramator quimbayensis TaxID=1147123 RepID=A0A1T4XYI7_9CLOT|nr:GNAT family N-acetyltransferase [Caloramator quimbayensis]SKA94453.1 Acetyltransferase (GNAT) domain-containing protein [Caloramator quimbayensis]